MWCRLKKQFETLTNDHKVAMAELQALRAESAKAGNDLEFHKNQAGNVVTLQKIIDKQQDQIDEMKKALEKSKQQEKVS
jgi:FAD synthase